MDIPTEFGGSWPRFIAEWCLGTPPEYPRELVESALGALVRLWPEDVAEKVRSDRQGPFTVAPAIDNGIVLYRTESLKGFDNVLQRLRRGEHSAMSELTVAAHLVAAGYRPVLEPMLEGKSPDLLVISEGTQIYCEVVAPDQSQTTTQAYALISHLATNITEQNPGMQVEVVLDGDIDDEVADEIIELIRHLEPSDSIKSLASVARVMKEHAEGAPTTTQIPKETGLWLFVAGGTIGQPGTRTHVGVAFSDARAKRLLQAEAHHFSKGEANLLVMDLTNLPGAIRSWQPLLQRCLQPTQNRRFSAIVLFQQGTRNVAIEREWAVIRNPHAYKFMHESLLSRFESPSD